MAHGFLRGVRRLLVLVALLAVAAAVLVAATAGWLYATQPNPRAVEAWSLGTPLPAARGELATAVAHAQPCASPPCTEAERLYVVGGLTGFYRPLRRVSVYDPNGKVWTAGPPLPAARHHLAAAGVGQMLYVGGGTAVAGLHLGAHWPPTDSFWRLTVGADRWEALEPMIEPRWGHRMVAHDGRLYVVGGRGPSGRVLIYTPDRGWSLGAEMPRPRDHLSVVVVVDGRIWAIGGRDPESLARVDIYDPATDTWSPGPELPAPTSGGAEGTIDGVIFIFGGEEPSLFGRVYDRHWMLDTRRTPQRWEPGTRPPLAVHGTSGAVLQGAMAIAGGSTRHGYLTLTGWSKELQLMRPGAVRR
jgi:Kelch motif protein